MLSVPYCILLIYFVCICVCMCGHAHAMGHVWMSEDIWLEPVLSCHCAGLRDLTQVIRLRGKLFINSVFLPALVGQFCKADSYLCVCLSVCARTHIYSQKCGCQWRPGEDI